MGSRGHGDSYKVWDSILGEVETHLKILATKKAIPGATLERWRWDEPDITLAWHLGDLGRNIHVLVVGESDSSLLVEVNAWWDEDLEDGKVRVRHWDNRKVADGVLSHEVKYDLFEEAYNIVSAWEKYKLPRLHYLNGKAVER